MGAVFSMLLACERSKSRIFARCVFSSARVVSALHIWEVPATTTIVVVSSESLLCGRSQAAILGCRLNDNEVTVDVYRIESDTSG